MPKNHATPEELPTDSLGSHLRNARTSQGKSIQEAARVTCINPTTLANLEADNFAKMPAEVFTRGFIKLYAQYLGLDANEIVKLYSRQENLDPERPAEQPYRRDVLTGESMANPLSLLKSNPRVRIVAILLAALLSFYALGVILKMVQNRPDLATQENELAKSLVDGNTQPLPGPPGGPPTSTEITGPTDITGTPTLASPGQGEQAGAGPAVGTPAAAYPTATPSDRQPIPAPPEKIASPATAPRSDVRAGGSGTTTNNGR